MTTFKPETFRYYFCLIFSIMMSLYCTVAASLDLIPDMTHTDEDVNQVFSNILSAVRITDLDKLKLPQKCCSLQKWSESTLE